MRTHRKLHEATRLLAQKRIGEAESICQMILGENPQEENANHVLGVIRLLKKDFDGAIESFEESLKRAPNQPSVLVKLGQAYNERRDFKGAEQVFRKAIALNPGEAEAFYWLGTAALGKNDQEKAREFFELAIAAAPTFSMAYEALLRVPGFEPDQTFLDCLYDNAENVARSREDAVYAHYALARYFKKGNKLEEFSAHIEEANAIQREGAEDRLDHTNALVLDSLKLFNPGLLEQASEQKAKLLTPIFIVGMPRAGSTLVEQILSCHREVFAGDELYFLHTHLISEFEKHTGKPYPKGLGEVSKQGWEAVGRAYQERLNSLSKGKAFVTDKLFSNALYVGAIRMAMPWAKVIYVKRDPLDTAFSIYSNFFGDALGWCCNQEAMAVYMKQTEKMIKHWHSLDANFVHEVQYEDLVADLETEARGILDFCGLEWQPACLDFHKSKRQVLTLSVAQVHRPVYASSIGQGKRFIELMAPFLKMYQTDP